MSAVTQQSDVYGFERATLRERMEVALHPHARWRDAREAMGGMAHRADYTPWECTVAAAISWLRRHRDGAEHPAAADALWCLLVQEHCAAQMLAVATALARQWRNDISRVRRMTWDSPQLGEVEIAAGIMVIRCTSGVLTRDKPKLDWQLWERLQRSGERTVWDWARDAERRAGVVLR